MNRERSIIVSVVVLGLLLYLVPAVVFFSPSVSDSSGASAGAEQSTETQLAFSDIAAENGLVYESVRKQPGMRGTISRSGVFVADYNNDMKTDVLLLGDERPVLFTNTGERFEKSGALSGLNESAQYRTALFVDYDNDGWQDLVLAPLFGEPMLFHNDNGTFSARPEAFDRRLNTPVALAAADYNGDGCADLFATQNGNWERAYPARVLTNRTTDNGQPNYLFRGTCTDEFETVTSAGITGNHWSLSTSFADFTGDGSPDIHVANDFHHDLLYVNQRNGTFTPREIPNTNRNGMASEAEDVDGDGDLDIFVSNIYWTESIRDKLGSIGIITEGSIGNNLLINNGEGSFTDRATEYDVRNGRWGWAASMTDFDNDADLDLIHTTREQFVPEELEEKWGDEFEYYQQTRVFERVERDRFADRLATTIGMVKTDGRGLGQLDFDADGRADLVIANADGPTRLYHNEAPNGNAVQIAVQPIDNRTALGTTVTVISTNGTSHQRITSKADFLSQDSRILHFGMGSAQRVETIRIEYPDGTVARFRGVCTRQRLVVKGDRIVDRTQLGNATGTACRGS